MTWLQAPARRWTLACRRAASQPAAFIPARKGVRPRGARGFVLPVFFEYSMPNFISAATLKAMLHDGQEIALLDVREHGQYGEAHLFYAASLPYSRLELDIHRLVPRKQVRIVVYDGGDEASRDVAGRAALRLQALGYAQVMILEGGARAW